MKLNDLDRALKSFDKSMDLANVLEDEAAQNAISKAVNDLKAQMNGGELTICTLISNACTMLQFRA